MSRREVFTSALGVDEMLLLEQAAWEPLEVVTGDCLAADVRARPVPDNGRRAVDQDGRYISRLLSETRLHAVRRMREEARGFGATGVVGVALLDDADGTDERLITATGTAIRETGQPRPPQPFTAHLSGRETWALLGAGYRPVGVVVGISVVRAPPSAARIRGVGEVPVLSDAVYMSRRHAMARIREQARSLRAAGVVGVDVRTVVTDHPRGPAVRFTAIGTAVAATAGWRHKPVRLALPLADAQRSSLIRGPGAG